MTTQDQQKVEKALRIAKEAHRQILILANELDYDSNEQGELKDNLAYAIKKYSDTVESNLGL